MQVCDATTERTPLERAVGVAFLWPVAAHTLGTLDGCLHTEHGTLFVVEFDGIEVEGMFDTQTLGPVAKSADDFP